MKTLFNVVAAYFRVCTATMNACANSIRTEGAVLVPFIKDIRTGFHESTLPAAIKEYALASSAQSCNPPAWSSEVRAQHKLIKADYQAMRQEVANAVSAQDEEDLRETNLRAKQEDFDKVANSVLSM